MNNCREIITLQFGHYSNFVGAHFWNTQELSFDYTGKKTSDVNHDVLYREGLSNNKVTYTPRLLLAELQGGLGSLSSSGGLSQESPEYVDDLNEVWTNIEKKEEQKIEKNQYLKYINNEINEFDSEGFSFENNVKTWTDFLFPRFHHRTVSLINEYKHSADKVTFDVHHMGENLWKRTQFSETFCDGIRRYSEECDNFQGFQIICDVTDGFGGLTASCLQYLNDEYSNKSTFCIPVLPSFYNDHNTEPVDVSTMNDSVRLINLILTTEKLFEGCSLFVPISLGETGWRKPGNKREFINLNYNEKIHYHTSAIIASAIDTLSLCYRNRNKLMTLSDLCMDMTGYGRKMAAASLGLPFYMLEKDDLIDHLNKRDHRISTCITPNCNIPNEKIFQHISVRGIPEEKLKRSLKQADDQIQLAAYKCESVKEMLEFYYQCNYYATATHVTSSPYGFEVKMPFPKLFSKDLNTTGFVKEFVDDTEPESVPIVSAVHNGNFIFDTLGSLHQQAKRIKINKFHKFIEEGLEADDYNECLDKIAEIQTNYEDQIQL